MTAGIETLKLLSQKGVYKALDEKAGMLSQGIKSAADKAGIPTFSARVGSMSTLFFTDSTVADYSGAKRCDTGTFARYFSEMLRQGIYLAPSQFESSFLSLAHTEENLDNTIAAAATVFSTISP